MTKNTAVKQFSILLLSVIFCLSFKSLDYLPVPARDVVRHSYFTLSYNEKYEQANWVCYLLTDSMVLNGGEERSNKFKMDKLVPTESARSADYTKTGYDRGHLCPAADMGFSPVAMGESFFMSNISPQVPEFNRGIWKELETTVREWAKKEKKLLVVTGPVFKDLKGSIGQEEVAVPGYFYKVILDMTDSPRLIAFLMPNAGSDRPLTDFAVPADELEKLTGLDFFSQLPEDQENRLEAAVQLAGWFPGYELKEEPLAEKPLQKQTSSGSEQSDYTFYLVLFGIILLVVILVWLMNSRKKK